MKAGRTKYGWFDRLELCEFLDVTGHWFDNQIKPHIPGDKMDKSSSTHLFYGRTIVEIFAILRTVISQKAKAALSGIPGVSGVNLLDINGKSRATERLRTEQFRIARLERMELEKKLVSRREVEEGLARLATALKEAGDQMNKLDPRCTEILNEAIEKMEKIEVIPTEALRGQTLNQRLISSERPIGGPNPRRTKEWAEEQKKKAKL